MPTSLRDESVQAIANAEFRTAWPIEVRKALVRAAQHQGEFPVYAEKHVKWALGQARRIERRMSEDIASGTSLLSQKQRKQLARA